MNNLTQRWKTLLDKLNLAYEAAPSPIPADAALLVHHFRAEGSTVMFFGDDNTKQYWTTLPHGMHGMVTAFEITDQELENPKKCSGLMEVLDEWGFIRNTRYAHEEYNTIAWDDALADYLKLVRTAHQALVATIGVPDQDFPADADLSGADRTPCGKRIVWRFDSSGRIYVRLQGQKAVWYNFMPPNEGNIPAAEIEKIYHIPRLSKEEATALTNRGVMTNGYIFFPMVP